MSESLILRQLDAAELAVLGERVFCDDELGFRWSPVDELPEDAALMRLNARNEAVLRTLALMEEHDETQAEDAERAEVHRLEAKLNLALELLAELVAGRGDSAPVRAVRFNGRGLCWDCRQAVAAGTLLLAECYVLPTWPVPLKLHVRVCSCDARNGSYRLCSRLEGLSTGAKEWLDKLVFRRHRRTVALSRSPR